MKTYEQPKYAVTIDASYPVVVAEKGWSLIAPTFNATSPQTGVYVSDVTGGAFRSQIPEDASLVLHNADVALIDTLKAKAKTLNKVEFNFSGKSNGLAISVKGMSAHSSEPESGINAIAYLAELFKGVELENNSDGELIDFVNQLIGLDIHGKQFGEIAYKHDFMLLDGAPHAQNLLDIFKHFTGDEKADFVSIGGGTNAKLFDNAVSFGPSMPGKRYTGHSEHEFMTLEQLELNLRMYTAMMIELGNM